MLVRSDTELRLSDAGPMVSESASSAWRQINLVGLNRRAGSATGSVSFSGPCRQYLCLLHRAAQWRCGHTRATKAACGRCGRRLDQVLPRAPEVPFLGVNRLGGSYVKVAVTGVRRVAVVVLWTGRSHCRHAGITPANRSALRLQAQHRRIRRRPAIHSRHCPAGYVRDRSCRAR